MSVVADADIEALLPSAVESRASHIRNESGSMSLADVRRLLEQDLGVEKFALDPQKALIRKLVDEVLIAPNITEVPSQEGTKQLAKEDETVPDNEISTEVSDKRQQQKKVSHKKDRQGKKAGKHGEDHKSGVSQEEDFHVEVPKKKKRMEIKGKVHTSSKVDEDMMEEEESLSHPEVSDERSDVSEGRKPQKALLKKHADVKSTHDKEAEHLKKIIKACGMNVPPSIYKKAKQVSDSKRDSFLREELEGILRRQGLSSNPSEKEIKAVKKKLAREKDLEGIDTTNIIMEPRGRRAASQVFIPIYKAPVDEQDSDEDAEENDKNAKFYEDDVKSFSDAEGSDKE